MRAAQLSHPVVGTHPRIDILGIGVSAIDMQSAVTATEELIERGERGYICVTGMHGIMEAQKDASLAAILNGSYLTTPDGMPTVWIGRSHGYSKMRRVYGPDYMLEMCGAGAKRGYRMFLYGGNDGVAKKLAVELERRFPGLQIVGTYTPPFRALNESEQKELIQFVSETRPDILWVGLSTPKQERFMAEFMHLLDVQLMVGVGAAFDIHTGGISDSPAWIKNIGMQWFHRLLQEPRRLWRRYSYNCPRFVWRVLLQSVGVRKY